MSQFLNNGSKQNCINGFALVDDCAGDMVFTKTCQRLLMVAFLTSPFCRLCSLVLVQAVLPGYSVFFSV